MNNVGQVNINDAVCDIVKFNSADFSKIRRFVLGICKRFDDPTFFIIDDIDSVLPSILKEKYGLVYGITCGNEIIAIQAINYGIDELLNFSEVLEIAKDIIFMEVGWAMVAPLYRKNNLSTQLSKLLEQTAFKETGNEICVATVHPLNISSVFLFLRLGYIGVKLTYHFNLIRLIMVKKIHLHFPFNVVHEFIAIKNSDYNQQFHLMEKGYVCHDAFIEQNNVLLKFIKFDFKSCIEVG
jgi:RimJ/RimL family protein N-acetyltransferase